MNAKKGAELRADQAREAELEEKATALLKSAGAFRRRSGVRSPRSLQEQQTGVGEWREWLHCRVVDFAPRGAWKDLDALADALALKPAQRLALGLYRLEDLTYQQIAAIMKTRVWKVRRLIRLAEVRCQLREADPPLSAQSLFWEEIRQKEACIYRAPSKTKRVVRRCIRHMWKQRLQGDEVVVAEERAQGKTPEPEQAD